LMDITMKKMTVTPILQGKAGERGPAHTRSVRRSIPPKGSSQKKDDYPDIFPHAKRLFKIRLPPFSQKKESFAQPNLRRILRTRLVVVRSGGRGLPTQRGAILSLRTAPRTYEPRTSVQPPVDGPWCNLLSKRTGILKFQNTLRLPSGAPVPFLTKKRRRSRNCLSALTADYEGNLNNPSAIRPRTLPTAGS
jgi:hypothetical protein